MKGKVSVQIDFFMFTSKQIRGPQKVTFAWSVSSFSILHEQSFLGFFVFLSGIPCHQVCILFKLTDRIILQNVEAFSHKVIVAGSAEIKARSRCEASANILSWSRWLTIFGNLFCVRVIWVRCMAIRFFQFVHPHLEKTAAHTGGNRKAWFLSKRPSFGHYNGKDELSYSKCFHPASISAACGTAKENRLERIFHLKALNEYWYLEVTLFASLLSFHDTVAQVHLRFE